MARGHYSPFKPLKSSNPFFIFLHEFRYKLNGNLEKPLNPIKVAQMAGEKWRQMSYEDKFLYGVWARKNQQQKRFTNKIQNLVAKKRFKLK
ncbi:uncharacterized protein ACRADG_010888 [Cochliomyia hominivorax]